ncbi:hypothetical protein L2E82_33501 [Cichorium intybus]|uniref:Uncharacterized protein n=2 Tax=Cichorium intybus TaxID=13427 RepID=A0ACB9BKB0_CICIN|nr:hypothetical protein L2E82_33500 [Cichorium intybus]KAI3722463.1 hypothetical protein L2E82_33501 [Cichorium intybus]
MQNADYTSRSEPLSPGQIEQWIDFTSLEIDTNLLKWLMPRFGYSNYLASEYGHGSNCTLYLSIQMEDPKIRVVASWEPTVLATMYMGVVITICSKKRWEQLEYSFIDSELPRKKH